MVRKRMLVAKTCKKCNREFNVDLMIKNACIRKFCSDKCKSVYWRQYRKAWFRRSIEIKRAAHASVKPKALCRYCGKEFDIPYGKMKVYCSPHCRKKFGVHGHEGSVRQFMEPNPHIAGTGLERVGDSPIQAVLVTSAGA